MLKEDQSTRKWLSQLLINLETPTPTSTPITNTQQTSSNTPVQQPTQSGSGLEMG